MQKHAMVALRTSVLSVMSALCLSACGGSARPPNDGMCKDSPAPAPACVRGRTVILVRHAEKGTDAANPKDPPLSDRGKARSKMLATLLSTSGVTKILSTPYKRTQETVAPLSEKAAVPVESMAPEKMRDAVKAAPDGAVIVIASHSNLIPPLVKELSNHELRGVENGIIPEDQYSRVVVVAQPCGAKEPSVIEMSSTAD